MNSSCAHVNQCPFEVGAAYARMLSYQSLLTELVSKQERIERSVRFIQKVGHDTTQATREQILQTGILGQIVLNSLDETSEHTITEKKLDERAELICARLSYYKKKLQELSNVVEDVEKKCGFNDACGMMSFPDLSYIMGYLEEKERTALSIFEETLRSQEERNHAH